MINQKICKNCVLPESSLFHLDATGSCKLCNSPDLFRHIIRKPDNEKLTQLIDYIKQKATNHKYDCIAAWSGGRDSTFMLHELVKKHNLRCVAVFGKTPFTPDEIIDSVHSISEKLKIKLIEVQTPANHQEIAGYCLREYLKTQMPILINLACASCKFINREIFKPEQAKRLGIRTIILAEIDLSIFHQDLPQLISIPKTVIHSLIWQGITYLV